MADPGVSEGGSTGRAAATCRPPPGTSGGVVSGGAAAASRARRDSSLRHWSIIRRPAVHQPGHWLLQHAVPRPAGRGGHQRLLDGVLGRIEVAVAAHDGAEDPRRQLAQQVLSR